MWKVVGNCLSNISAVLHKVLKFYHLNFGTKKLKKKKFSKFEFSLILFQTCISVSKKIITEFPWQLHKKYFIYSILSSSLHFSSLPPSLPLSLPLSLFLLIWDQKKEKKQNWKEWRKTCKMDKIFSFFSQFQKFSTPKKKILIS